ncbi:MAG: 30S ribosome-binding factor RbfA [bacterium]
MARSRPIRPARVASVVREVVARTLTFEIKDPRVAGVTISDLEVTGDLQEVRVFFHVDGGPQRVAEALVGLERASGFIRRAIGEQVRLRLTPRLVFRHDASLEYASRIEARLAELGLGSARPTGGGDDDEGDEGEGDSTTRPISTMIPTSMTPKTRPEGPLT